MSAHANLPPLDPDVASAVATERSSARGPNRAQRGRLRARLAATLAVSAAAATSAPAAGAMLGGGLAKPAALIVAIALGTGAAVGIYRAARSPGAGEAEATRTELAPGTSDPAGPAIPTWVLERQLVQEARAALAEGRDLWALERLDEHARRFSAGLLVEEREALRVQALVDLGRLQEAHAAASRFIGTYPASVHRDGVQRALPPPAEPAEGPGPRRGSRR
jgi:hypothetical protein